jgi:hypothetical protein
MAYIGAGQLKAQPANALQICGIRGRGPSITADLKRFGWGAEAACITTMVCLEQGKMKRGSE